MRAKEIRSLEDARQARVSEIRLCLDRAQIESGIAAALKEVLTLGRGGNCPVTVDYKQPDGLARVRFGQAWQVNPSDALLDQLRGTVGGEAVQLVYEA